jgi:hypothetical protein
MEPPRLYSVRPFRVFFLQERWVRGVRLNSLAEGASGGVFLCDKLDSVPLELEADGGHARRPSVIFDPGFAPSAMCRCGPEDYAVLNCNRHAVRRMTREGEIVWATGGWSASPRLFSYPEDIRELPDGMLVVSDKCNSRLVVLDALTGSPVRMLTLGCLCEPLAHAAGEGAAASASREAVRREHRLSASWRPLECAKEQDCNEETRILAHTHPRHHGPDASCAVHATATFAPSKLAVDSTRGLIFVLDASGAGRVWVFRLLDGALVTEDACTGSWHMDSDGKERRSDRSVSTNVQSESGARGTRTTPGMRLKHHHRVFPCDIAVDAAGRLLVADARHHCVFVYTANGCVESIQTPEQPVVIHVDESCRLLVGCCQTDDRDRIVGRGVVYVFPPP